MDKEKISVAYKDAQLIGDVISDGGKPKLLILHGSGSSNRSRYDILRGLLAEKNISSIAFDFIGHGETGGEMERSGLHDRTLQAQAVIETLKLEEVNIFGSSMGGYNAIKLLEIFPVKSLILAAPSVYDIKAYDLNFDSTFTNAIRKNKIDSDAWDILAKFAGCFLLFYGDKDEVIPKEVTDKIWSSAILAKKEKIVFPNVEHRINLYLRSHIEDMQKIVNKIADIL